MLETGNYNCSWVYVGTTYNAWKNVISYSSYINPLLKGIKKRRIQRPKSIEYANTLYLYNAIPALSHVRWAISKRKRERKRKEKKRIQDPHTATKDAI